LAFHFIEFSARCHFSAIFTRRQFIAPTPLMPDAAAAAAYADFRHFSRH
jgi:hypothetical protein